MANSKRQKPKQEQRKLRAYQVTLKSLALVGIDSNLMLQSYPINVKMVMGYLLVFVGIVLMLVFIFNESKTFAEYTQAVYMCSLSALIVFALIILSAKVHNLFQFIKNMDDVINSSE